jgi:hypothetical protein
MANQQPFFFRTSELQEMCQRLRSKYKTAKPFPHVVIDDFLPSRVLDGVLEEFPRPGATNTWNKYESKAVKKLSMTAGREESVGPRIRQLLLQFNSGVLLQFVEAVTGIQGLIPDPYFKGGGCHEIPRGGFLKIHADFNYYEPLQLDRRINLIVYLNRGWKEEYGGHLEFWKPDMSQCVKRVLPIFNRCVIFNTTDTSYHGHPEPITCPPNMSRKSLAFYYYSNGRPSEEKSSPHPTLFQKRPEDGHDPTNWAELRHTTSPGDFVRRPDGTLVFRALSTLSGAQKPSPKRTRAQRSE